MKFTFAPEARPLEGFTIKRAIYRGGFGEVYYALSDAGREVALKLLQNNTEVELRGVRQCLNLSHPNLVTIFDVRQDGDGDHWIVMEYVSGDTLDVAIRRHPDGMPMEDIRRWLPGLAAGVSFLHDRGLVHRDLKPGNIFIENGVVKVGDVGLSKFIAPSRRSAHTQSVGTVYYMAPEVAKGKYGKEVDVYALGIILYEMLTGRVPFDGESTGEILMKHLSQAPDLSALPVRLRPVIGRALEKDPARRQTSVARLAGDFEDAVIGRRPPLDIPESCFAQVRPASPLRPAATNNAAARVARPQAAGVPAATFHPRSQIWLWLGIAGVALAPLAGSLALVALVPLVGSLVLAVPAQNAGRSRGHPHTGPRGRRTQVVRLSPTSLRDVAWQTRVAHFTGSAAVAGLLTALMTCGIAILSPRFFANANGEPVMDPATIGLFAGTAIAAAWGLLASMKLLEGRAFSGVTRRLTLLATGLLVGFAAWGLDEFLMVSFIHPRVLLDTAFDIQPFPGPLGRTQVGYCLFFGLLLALRRWWWQTDSYRPARLRISSLLWTAAMAWLVATACGFPQTWAVVWATVISSVVQLSSVWVPPAERPRITA